MDSDKRSPHSRLNQTKLRIKSEIEKFGGFVWITKGREIENYIDKKILDGCLRKVHPQLFGRALACDQYGIAYQFEKRVGRGQPAEVFSGANKVRLAREVVLHEPSLDILDLRERVRDLGALIRRANREFD